MKAQSITSLRILFFLILALSNVVAQEATFLCKGDKYFDQNQFKQALEAYLKDGTSRNKKISQHAQLRVADCYRIMGEFEKAEAAYKKIQKRKKNNAESCLNYGLSLKSSAKFEEAKQQFTEYIKLNPNDPMGKIHLASCDSAQNWLDQTIGKEVKNIEKINTEASEFSPFIFKDQLYFCSSREGSKQALISFDGGNSIERLDIYSILINNLTKEAENKKDISNLGGLNTSMHEGSASFSTDGSEVYFTRTKKGKRDKDSNNITDVLQLFYSKKDSSGNWSKPTNDLPFNSSQYSCFHPSLSKDGNTLFFASDKPGGLGKTDIYFTKKQSDDSWGKAINAGNKVNTFGYEFFPTIYNDSTLYFSSNVHAGMGQLDIFESNLINGKWDKIQNLKPPINSIGNDFGITFDTKNNRGFFSSDRINGKGAEDIYSFSEAEELELELNDDSITFSDKSIFDNIKYKLMNEKDLLETELVSTNGLYTFKLSNNTGYILIAKKNGFPYNKIQFKLCQDTLSREFIFRFRSTDRSAILKGRLSELPGKKANAITNSLQIISSGNSYVIEPDQRGNFKFNEEIMPDKEYLFSYKIQNQ